MAASFGERLLAEVREETFDELLHELRALHPAESDEASFLGVKELDELLGLFLPAPTSTTTAGLGEQGPRNDLHAVGEEEAGDADEEHGMDVASTRAIPTPLKKRRHPVLEITSPSSGAGKTQLLYYLVAVAVLPSTYRGRSLGGRDAAVVFLDTDGRFDANRLRGIAASIVRRKMKASAQQPAEDISAGEEGVETTTAEDLVQDLDDLIRTALHHVHVFRPQSSSSLLATLQHLDSYLLDLSRHRSATRPLHAIFLDSASAFFWQDRLRDEVARTEEIGRPAAEIERDREQGQSFHLAVLYRRLVVELRRLQAIFDCAVVYTTWGGVSRGKTYRREDPSPVDVYYRAATPAFKPHLPPPWGTFPSLRIVVQRESIRPFTPGITLPDAERDAPLRHEVVSQGKFWAWVDGWGREEWPWRVLEGLERRNGGSFAFWVGDGMVVGRGMI